MLFEPPETILGAISYGLGTGAKGLFNGGSNAIANLVTVGGLLGDPAANPLKFEFNEYQKAIGAEYSELSGTVVGEIVVGLGTGGLSTAGKVGKVVAAADAAGNVYGGVQAANDIRNNGLNLGNSLQLAGAALGTAGQLGGRRMANAVDDLAGDLDAAATAALRNSDELADAGRMAKPKVVDPDAVDDVGCFVGDTNVHTTQSRTRRKSIQLAELSEESPVGTYQLLSATVGMVVVTGIVLGKFQRDNRRRQAQLAHEAAIAQLAEEDAYNHSED